MRPLLLMTSMVLSYSIVARAVVPEDFISSIKTAKVVDGRFELERSKTGPESRQYTVTNIDKLVLDIPGKGQFEILYDRYGNEMEIEVVKQGAQNEKHTTFLVDAIDSETRLIHDELLSLTRKVRLSDTTLSKAALLENSIITKIVYSIEANAAGTRDLGVPLSFELLSSKGELIKVEFDVQKNEVEAFIDVTDVAGKTKFKTAYSDASSSLRAALLEKAEYLKKFYVPTEQRKQVLGKPVKRALTERLKLFTKGGQQKSSESFVLELIPAWEVRGYQQGHQSSWGFRNYFSELASSARSCAKVLLGSQ